MAALGKVLLALSFFLVTACRYREASETKVIPAIPAKEGEFGSLVKIGDCSGVKVGERKFITSALCVVDFGGRGHPRSKLAYATQNL